MIRSPICVNSKSITQKRKPFLFDFFFFLTLFFGSFVFVFVGVYSRNLSYRPRETILFGTSPGPKPSLRPPSRESPTNTSLTPCSHSLTHYSHHDLKLRRLPPPGRPQVLPFPTVLFITLRKRPSKSGSTLLLRLRRRHSVVLSVATPNDKGTYESEIPRCPTLTYRID